MKLGNISQTIVPVPNFYIEGKKLTNEIPILPKSVNKSTLDAVSRSNRNKSLQKNKRNHSYFRDRDLFSSFYDLNLCNNPRPFKKEIDTNEKKYIPIYDRENYPRNSDLKNTYFPDIIDTFKVKTHKNIDKKNGISCLRDFLESTNLNKFLKPNLRDEIMHNATILIKKINSDFDIKEWNDFDCRTTFSRIHQPAYSPLIDAINASKTIQQDFRNSLKNKTLSLRTINDKTKMILEKNLQKQESEEKEKKEKKKEINKQEIDKLLNNNKNNLQRLRKSCINPNEYSKKDMEFIEKNKSLTKKINNGVLYKDFPSKTRMEFTEKKILPIFRKYRASDSFSFDKNDYKCLKENFCCQNSMWTRPLHNDAFKIDN